MAETLKVKQPDISVTTVVSPWLNQRVRVNHEDVITFQDCQIGNVSRKIVGMVVAVPHEHDSRMHPTLVIRPERVESLYSYVGKRKNIESVDFNNPPDVIVMLEDLTYDIQLIDSTVPEQTAH